MRPYRPVPRGLISLKDLGWVWAGCIVIQFALALLACAETDRAVIPHLDLSRPDEQRVFRAALAESATAHVHGCAHGHHAPGSSLHYLLRLGACWFRQTAPRPAVVSPRQLLQWHGG